MTSKPYEIIVLGGGSAGIVSANLAAALGVRTALVEKERIGGECLWTGCVPSKALLHAASIASLRSGSCALGTPSPPLDRAAGAEALRYVRATIQRVREADASEAMLRGFGVELFFGAPSFEDRHVIQVGDQRLLGRQFILATGSRPAVPGHPRPH